MVALPPITVLVAPTIDGTECDEKCSDDDNDKGQKLGNAPRTESDGCINDFEAWDDVNFVRLRKATQLASVRSDDGMFVELEIGLLPTPKIDVKCLLWTSYRRSPRLPLDFSLPTTAGDSEASSV